MAGWFADEGLVTDSPPNVSVNENAGNPHYLPTADTSRPIGAGALVLLDLWGKLDAPGVGICRYHLGGIYREARRSSETVSLTRFGAVRDARDAGVALVQERVRAGRDIRGWEVDRAASSVLRNAGYGDQILHRTGHSLGEDVHGTGRQHG